MVSDIKFRQWVMGRWHLWGYIDGTFICPVTNNVTDPVNCRPTHLKDKDGWLIWEGDVVKFDVVGAFDLPPEHRLIGLVSIGPNGVAFGQWDSTCCTNMNVVGNIYEHPELKVYEGK